MQMPHDHCSFPGSQPYPLLPSSSSEFHTLESSIQRVVYHDGQQDAGDDGVLSTVTTVTIEILQEAAEHIRATLGEILGGERSTAPPPTPPGGVMGR